MLLKEKLTFDKAFEMIIGVEQGYVNHKSDPGGRTMYGITEKYHPEYWVDGPPTYDAAKEFYRAQWDALRLDEVESGIVAHEIFDSATLHGPVRAVLFLQVAMNYWVNILRKRGIPLCLPLKEDGTIGDKTLSAVNKFCQSEEYARALYAMMNHVQATRIMSQENPDFQVGWFAKRIWGIID